MGGSGQPGPSPRRPAAGRGETGAGRGQELGDAERKDACPSDFEAEVTDIPQAMRVAAEGVAVDTTLPIELREGDPAFLLDDQVLGWLAVNIEEVTACLEASWRYRGIVRANQTTPAGPLIVTQVVGTAPTA